MDEKEATVKGIEHTDSTYYTYKIKIYCKSLQHTLVCCLIWASKLPSDKHYSLLRCILEYSIYRVYNQG